MTEVVIDFILEQKKVCSTAVMTKSIYFIWNVEESFTHNMS